MKIPFYQREILCLMLSTNLKPTIKFLKEKVKFLGWSDQTWLISSNRTDPVKQNWSCYNKLILSKQTHPVRLIVKQDWSSEKIHKKSRKDDTLHINNRNQSTTHSNLRLQIHFLLLFYHTYYHYKNKVVIHISNIFYKHPILSYWSSNVWIFLLNISLITLCKIFMSNLLIHVSQFKIF